MIFSRPMINVIISSSSLIIWQELPNFRRNMMMKAFPAGKAVWKDLHMEEVCLWNNGFRE